MMGYPIQELETVDSTNNYAMAQVHAGLAKHGNAWFAHRQYAGKGQRGKEWQSEPGQNVILSVVVEPYRFTQLTPFLLTETFSVTIADICNNITNGDITIKWPNDIYWCDRKAGGILIENVFRGSQWSFAVCGIGLNINQTDFHETTGRPVSIRQITGKIAEPLEIAQKIASSFFQTLDDLNGEVIHQKYNEHLFAKGSVVRLQTKDNTILPVIDHVDTAGRLHTIQPEHIFSFGEVQWLIG
jgi:BirA family transcriptional regulator, biotin operon repressor / biotin---[acetyl-CoA-carboxylase] ligase